MQVAHHGTHLSLRAIALLVAGVFAAVLLVSSLTAFVRSDGYDGVETNRPFGT